MTTRPNHNPEGLRIINHIRLHNLFHNYHICMFMQAFCYFWAGPSYLQTLGLTHDSLGRSCQAAIRHSRSTWRKPRPGVIDLIDKLSRSHLTPVRVLPHPLPCASILPLAPPARPSPDHLR